MIVLKPNSTALSKRFAKGLKSNAPEDSLSTSRFHCKFMACIQPHHPENVRPPRQLVEGVSHRCHQGHTDPRFHTTEVPQSK